MIFWASTLAVFHSYVLYPLMLGWLTRKKENNCQVYDAGTSPGEWPYVVGVLAVHNEEAVLEKTLTSVFDSDYPEDRFELLIAADNCTDRSIEIIKQFQERHRNLRLRVFEGRNGKINVLNRMLGEQRVRLSLEGDYALIMFDANVCWARDLPWRLVQHFRNPKIGQVGSNVLDSRKEHHGIADEEASYVNRENTIKFQEGVLWGRMMGRLRCLFTRCAADSSNRCRRNVTRTISSTPCAVSNSATTPSSNQKRMPSRMSSEGHPGRVSPENAGSPPPTSATSSAFGNS